MPFAFSPVAEEKGIAFWPARHRIPPADGRAGTAVADLAFMIKFYRTE
jgi:hypothetical protein